jgi:hypothetical protein
VANASSSCPYPREPGLFSGGKTGYKHACFAFSGGNKIQRKPADALGSATSAEHGESLFGFREIRFQHAFLTFGLVYEVKLVTGIEDAHFDFLPEVAQGSRFDIYF